MNTTLFCADSKEFENEDFVTSASSISSTELENVHSTRSPRTTAREPSVSPDASLVHD